MHRKIHTLLFLTVFLFLSISFLSSAFGSAHVANIGTPPNFSAQQAGPDSAYGTLAEGNMRVIEDYVDGISDVDNSPDIGTHSNFESQKYYDSIYDTLTEQNTGVGEITKVGTDTSGTGTSLTLSFSHTLVSGTARIVIVSIGVENGDTIDVSTVTYGGVTMTLAVEGITGTSGFRCLCEIWYILEDDLPSDGSKTVAITCTGTASTPEINAFCSEYTGVSQGAPEATAEHHQTTGATIANDISPSDGAWVMSVVGSGNTGSWTHGEGQVEVLDFADASSAFAVAELRGASGENSLSSTFSATVNRLERVAASWVAAVEEDRYELDLEVQFTAVIDFLSTEELCICTGTLSSEDLRVDFWNGTGWENLATDLTANSFNNYTVSLTSTTFTIRFRDGTTEGDTTQDQWQIDASLLRVEGAGSKEDAVDQQSNVDGSADVGTHSDFNVMKTRDGYDNLTESKSQQQYTFFEDWESGSIASENWTTYSSVAQGRIVVDTDTPYEGGYAVWMDVSTSGTYALNELITNFDFSGATQVVLDFYHNEHGDENQAGSDHTGHQNADAVYYTLDGSYWYHLVNLVDPSGWTNVHINVTADPDFKGPVNSSFAIKFTQYDNYPRTSDGRGFENINITCSTAGTNCMMDLEVQWIDLPYLIPNANLSIYGGTMGDEDIKVDVWNGTGWETVFTDLSSGWNNASIADWLTTSSFTIRFKDANETGDINPDTWQVDIALIHMWNEAVENPPVPDFSFSPEYPFKGDTVTFNASASYDPDGTIVSYLWDFGDETNVTGEVATHVYADDGTFTVTLTVTDNDGLSDSTSKYITVLNRPPIATFTESAESVYTGETITFNASASYDPDGSILSYFWDFGDGTNATGVVVSHSYVDDGSYSVTLTVTDEDGATDTASSVKTVLNRAPVASFTESAETVYTGETIHFDASQSYDQDGVIVNYFWDFGDGSNASGAIVDHAYANDGTYTVTLTVTDDDGATDDVASAKTVSNRSPTASFTESAESVDTGVTIYFDASASYDPDGSIVSYFWDFGDGTNASGITATHAYANNGNYIVTLTVTDDDGSVDTASATKTVFNRPPVASFTESDETVYVGESITFDASGSYDIDGSLVSYFWTFGDGTNATGVVVEHAFTDNSVYTVTLTVTDDDGATASTSAVKTILNISPIASFTESAETVPTQQTITFDATASYDPDGTIVSYFWDFGDGSNATGVTVQHAYSDNGFYNVTLTVADDDYATDTASSTKTVTNRSPVVTFTESAETVYIGEYITFNAMSSYDPDGTIVSYFWDFGDGINATGVAASHAYSINGTFIVTLTVIDNDGASNSTAATKTVLYNDPPVASFTESAETVYTGDVITFNASSSYDSDGSVVSYFWDFGDGANATGMVVTHAYVDDGIYTVTLTVTDDLGAIGSSISSKNILNRIPTTSFTESAETALTGEIIYFDASDSYDSDGSIVSYFWSFGDGTNATGVTVSHDYSDNGVYTVTLRVTDDDGATATSNATKTVLNRPPVASFTESATTVYTGEIIILNASSSYDPDGTIVSYFWDFGDGTNATGITVSHSYADDGVYTVALSVTDNDGATSNTLSTKTVLNRSPVASFTESATAAYTNDLIYFDASLSYDPDGSVASFFWNFGDGTNVSGVLASHAYAENGVYTITLTVTDNDGATSTATATKTILNRLPIASFTESATVALTGEVINFNASGSYDSDGTIVTFFWTFGDGTNATGITVNHAYLDDGTYTVTLTVTDNDGGSTSVSATKTVLNRPPTASFTESATTAYTSEPLTFNATISYDPDGSIASYTWNFGDGNITTVTYSVIIHIYSDDGTYTVTLTVTDDDGTTANATATKTILNRAPVASFTESASAVFTGESITFNASGSYDSDGSIVSYSWTFGDGANANGLTVTHAYVNDGTYTVTLTITDNDGATATSNATKTVLNRPPVTSFTESAATVYTGQTITFNASVSYDPDGEIISYFWDFGDGANATGAIVDHTYSDNGYYTVTLIATDDDGAASSTIATKTILNRAPSAFFAESTAATFTSEIIYFNASASYDVDGTIAGYFWTFGDGANATGVTVGHAYADDGTYTVTLIVTDNDGATADTTATKTISNRPPVASFMESATTVYTGDGISFNAYSSYDSDGTIVSYWWDFGDGTNETGVTVSHAYADDGTYTVMLTVTDDDGASDSISATKTVLNRPPVALFTESAETVYTGETIWLNASSSYDSDGHITGYSWMFGDGTNATGIYVNHTYPQKGSYTVTLTIIDDDGASSQKSAVKTVLNHPPTAVFTESAQTVSTGKTITFDASGSYDSDGSVVSYFWNFGDGATATGATAGHAYGDDGNYTVTLTVTDNDGATGNATSVKNILNKAPVASFTASATTVYTGAAITFDASESYDSDGVITSYFWNFGDETNTTGVIVTHSYADNGNYVVGLTVTDDDGANSTSTVTITVLNRVPVASFTESTTTVYTGEIVTFNATASYDPDGTITGYFWTFGDGTNATGITMTHSYTDDGSYTVTLTVTDNDGSTNIKTATKTVLNRPPTTLFTESAQSVVVGEVIYFNASASYDPDGTIVSYFWTFGDGANATGVLVSHAYSASGVYSVILTVTDDDGATTSQGSTKAVEITPPVTVFTESAQSTYTGETITFNASTSYDPDGTIVGYFWDFGDGANASGVVVTHTYVANGNYTVTLTVTDNDGATDTASATKTVLNRPPLASFTESAETVYMGQFIQFNASASYDADGFIASYFWDFGDGTNATGVVAEHVYNTNGTYIVTLTVTDDDSDFTTTSATKTIIWNEKPISSFTETAQTMYTGDVISFNASASYDPDGSIVNYFWNFGDSTNATGLNVDHAYADDGNYTVTLTVTDNLGATGTATATKTVMNRAPVALFTESSSTVYDGEVITFNASSSYDPDGVIVDFNWDFGDGRNATGAVVSRSYADNGTYVVTLTVTDDDNAQNSNSAVKTVLNSPPVAAFTESAESLGTNQLITFNASSSYDPDGFIASYFWTFGDETNATGVVVTHAYSINGTFIVTLNVTDEEGATAVATATKTITWNEPPVAIFTESSETIYQGETIAFNASNSYDSDGTIISFLWDFGDGTNATGLAVEHFYLNDGVFTVTLTVTDDKEATDVATVTKTILNKAPVVLFTESFTTVHTNETIGFNASNSYDPDGVIVSYLWNFGDGTNAVGIAVEHDYVDNGQYTVTLTLTDDDGAVASASATKTVLNRSPVAVFTVSSETVYTGEAVVFNASNSYDADGTIVNYLWDFGDGNAGNGKVVNHAFLDNRMYTITLTVTDNDMATNTTTKRVFVLNRAPVAIFVESAQTSYVGAPIGFDASSSYDPDGSVANYSWNFGDGITANGTKVNHTYSAAGTYIVTLTLTDNEGASSSAQATKMIIGNDPPVAAFTESTTTVYINESIAFNASASYDPDGMITSYFWDFGDGTDATGVTVQHAYTNNGNYVVALTVTDNNGATKTATATKEVMNRSPVAAFTESLETAFAGETIEFNASASYDPDGWVANYFWDFGDGTNATGVVASHAYLVNRTFTVTLTVTDDDGATNSVEATKTILGGLRDVAVIGVIPSATEVYKHRILNVSVIVANEGTEFETFNVTLCASKIHGWHLADADGRLVWYSDNENSADFLLFTSTVVPTENPTLTFETKYKFENFYDFGAVQISTDGGITWVSLENAYTTSNHEPDTDPDIITNLPGFTGTSAGWPAWRSMTFNLSDYGGKTVLLGFRYMTDSGYVEEGWYIDNVAVNGATIPNTAFTQLNLPPLNAIQTLMVNNLVPGSQTTLIFSWNTTSTLSGDYSIRAVASTVIAEIDTLDNVCVDGVVEVMLNPDINGDGTVDIFDVVAVTSIYGCKEGDSQWKPRVDLIEDGVIDIFDVVAVTSHYGETVRQ